MKNTFKIIITFLVIIISLLLILIYYKNEQKLDNIDEFAKFRSEQCKEWKIMSSWNKYPDWSVKVKHCIKPYLCTEWKKLKWSCWDLVIYISCKLECLWEWELP